MPFEVVIDDLRWVNGHARGHMAPAGDGHGRYSLAVMQ